MVKGMATGVPIFSMNLNKSMPVERRKTMAKLELQPLAPALVATFLLKFLTMKVVPIVNKSKQIVYLKTNLF